MSPACSRCARRASWARTSAACSRWSTRTGTAEMDGRAGDPDSRAGERGTTVVEVTLVVLVLGVLASMAWPRFAVAGEQARVDQAAAELRSIWVGQRLHWLETGEFAGNLATL